MLYLDSLIEDGIQVDAIITDPSYLISRKSVMLIIHLIKKNIQQNMENIKQILVNGRKELNLLELLDKFFKLLKDGGTLLMFYDVWKIQEQEAAEEYKFKQARLCEWVKTNPTTNSKLNRERNIDEEYEFNNRALINNEDEK